MQSRTLIAATLAAGALMGMGTAAQAVPAVVAGTTVYVQPAPPAPMYEAMPAPRAGYVWTPGHYEWRGDRYEWNTGRWLETRPGWAWQESRWQQRPDGSWFLAGGQWVRQDNYSAYDERTQDRRWHSERYGPYGDRDGDGIANRDDRDRDGDGVPNRYDNYPDDPNRS
jgi:hypothetical protein